MKTSFVSSRFFRPVGLPAALLLALTAPRAFSQTLIHDYELNGSLSDALGGPSLVAATPAGLGSTGYTFAKDQGLTLSNWTSPSDSSNDGNYTIDIGFSLNTTGGYNKIVDFNNLVSDTGVYTQNSNLDFYDQSFSSTGVIAANTEYDLVITRNATTGLFTGYINGVQEIQFNDLTLQQAIFGGTTNTSDVNNIITFFEDDAATGGNEATNGFVDYIRIYDGAATTAQIDAGLPLAPAPGGGVPDSASTALLLGAALAAIGAARRHLPALS